MLPAAPWMSARADEVYRSVDADGHVVYSDRAASANAHKTDIRVIRPDPAEVAKFAREREIQKADENQRRARQADEAQNDALADHAGDARCENARNRFYDLRDARRLYEHDAEGNRVYMSDADAQAKREQARQAMTDACEAR